MQFLTGAIGLVAALLSAIDAAFNTDKFKIANLVLGFATALINMGAMTFLAEDTAGTRGNLKFGFLTMH